MNCPQCGMEVGKIDRYCGSCGSDTRPTRSIEAMRVELDGIGKLSVSLNERLRALKIYLGNLDESIRAASTRPAPAKEPLPVNELPAETIAVDEVPEPEPAAKAPPPLPTAKPKPPKHYDPSPTLTRSRDRKKKSELNELQVGQRWLLIGGVIILVLGIGFFLKYSFDQNWISPAGRVATGFLVGVAGIGIGEFARRKKYDLFGFCLIGGGIATLYFATFAAFGFYHLIGQLLAFAIMFAITGLAVTLSLVYDSKALAVLGLIGGFATPLVLSSGGAHHIELLSYLVILNAGLLAIAFFKKWNILKWFGFAGTWVVFFSWYNWNYTAMMFWSTMLFASTYFLMYALIPWAYYFLRSSGTAIEGGALTSLNALFSFAVMWDMVYEHAGGHRAVAIISIGMAVVYAVLAFQLFRNIRTNPRPFGINVAQSAFFLVLTVPLLFSGYWIAIAWALQGTALMIIARKLDLIRLTPLAALLIFGATLKFFFYDYYTVLGFDVERLRFDGTWSLTFGARLLTAIATFGAIACGGWSLKPNSKSDWKGNAVYVLFYIATAVLTFGWLNAEVVGYCTEHVPDSRMAAVSVLWAIFAVSTIVLGFITHSSAVRKTALALFGATALKVVFIDMANVSTPGRILSFVVLGLLLIGASWLYYRFRSRILEVTGETTARD